ncbi:hypothetical protein CAEBREN_13840 [Caenorhabditis brenneri]|uniref:SPK domain-containing protein n=1 Tax=Caenorhabditis brenneri TaxID=135651 RepID=G0NF92_CAEBE|nr:hypothetical protein CAEBREN_13840 [Caenorhabditis brenneri]
MTSLSVENANPGNHHNRHLELIPEEDVLAAVGSLFLEGKRRLQNRLEHQNGSASNCKEPEATNSIEGDIYLASSDQKNNVQMALCNVLQTLARANLKKLEDDDVLFVFRLFYRDYEITNEQLLEEARGYKISVNELSQITDYSANVSINYSVEGSCLKKCKEDAPSQNKFLRARLYMSTDDLPPIQKRILNMLRNIWNYSIQQWDDKKLYEEFDEASSLAYEDFMKELKLLKAKIEKIGDLDFVTKLKIHFMTQLPMKREIGENVKKDFELKFSQERTISAMMINAKLTMSKTKGSSFERIQPKKSERGTASRKRNVLPTSSKDSEDEMPNIKSSRRVPSTSQPESTTKETVPRASSNDEFLITL